MHLVVLGVVPWEVRASSILGFGMIKSATQKTPLQLNKITTIALKKDSSQNLCLSLIYCIFVFFFIEEETSPLIS